MRGDDDNAVGSVVGGEEGDLIFNVGLAAGLLTVLVVVCYCLVFKRQRKSTELASQPAGAHSMEIEIEMPGRHTEKETHGRADS